LILLDELISKLESNFHKVNRRDSLGESRGHTDDSSRKNSRSRENGDRYQVMAIRSSAPFARTNSARPIEALLSSGSVSTALCHVARYFEEGTDNKRGMAKVPIDAK